VVWVEDAGYLDWNLLCAIDWSCPNVGYGHNEEKQKHQFACPS
jgi:hypothetical protein